MSRSLDPRVREALKHGDHEPVYMSVADALATRHEELLDIEILGPSHELPQGVHVLTEANAVAVPKFNILRAFLPAYIIFQSYLQCQNETWDEVIRATSVILLLDPEHMTAANARKRYIQHIKVTKAEKLENVLKTELYFTESLLTGRLHRHTKSPTLWGHREWLVKLCTARQQPVDGLATTLERLIFISAERHPRNYYAWCHARFLLGLASRTNQGRSRNHGDEQGQAAPAARNTVDLQIATDLVRKWCFSHHNDISGWSFLTVLVEERQRLAPEAGTATTLFSETLHLAEAYSWRGESVWCFLRSMMRGSWLDEAHGKEFNRVLLLVHGKMAVPTALDEQVLGNMVEWSRLYPGMNA